MIKNHDETSISYWSVESMPEEEDFDVYEENKILWAAVLILMVMLIISMFTTVWVML